MLEKFVSKPPDKTFTLSVQVDIWANPDGALRFSFSIPQDGKSFTIVRKKPEAIKDWSNNAEKLKIEGDDKK